MKEYFEVKFYSTSYNVLEAVSKIPEGNDQAGEVKKSAVDRDQSFVPHQQATKVAKPGKSSFDLPSLSIATKLSAILK